MASDKKHRDYPATVEELRDHVLEDAEAEFLAFWGEPWLGHGRACSWILARTEGEIENARTEREARELYVNLRRRKGSIEEECAEWRSRHPFGTGGNAANVLRWVRPGVPGTALPSLDELDRRYPSLVRHDGFLGVVWILVEEESVYPLDSILAGRGHGKIPNRQLAVIAILLGEAPEWGIYAAALDDDERATPVTAATVLRDIENRVRKLIGPDSRA